MRCPDCGLENLPQLDRCTRCGRGLGERLTPWSQVLPPRRAERAQRRARAARAWAGHAVAETLDNLREQVRIAPSELRRLWNLVWHQADTAQKGAVRRSPTLAALLSFIPGAGHLYARRGDIAIRLFGLFIGGLLLATATLWTSASNLILCLVLALQLLSMVWAVLEVRRQNPQVAFHGGALSAILLAAGILSGIYSGGAYIASRCYLLMGTGYALSSTCVTAGSTGVRLVAATAEFAAGDRLLVDRRASTRDRLKPGDVVFIETLPEAMIQRIIAGPSDVVTVDAGQVLRNGHQLTGAQMPLLPSGGSLSIPVTSITVDPGCYVILPYWLVEQHGGEESGAQRVYGTGLSTWAGYEVTGKVVAIYGPPAHRRMY